MIVAKVTSKGQITIPLQVRQVMHLGTGDGVEFIATNDGRFELALATQSVQALKGMFGKPPSPVSIEDMNHAIAAGAAGASPR